MTFLRSLIMGFIAGFFAVLIFHQGLWYLLELVGFTPFMRPAWALDPIPPFGVPSVLSKAFWGGIWAAVLAPLFMNLRGGAYWAAWVVVGSLAPTLVAFFVVPPIKGEPLPLLWPGIPAGLVINAFWGFGTALFLKLAHAALA
jgi:hypothetical protein